eukprot:287229-Chlamydomonas_euryale.AAC.2
MAAAVSSKPKRQAEGRRGARKKLGYKGRKQTAVYKGCDMGQGPVRVVLYLQPGLGSSLCLQG